MKIIIHIGHESNELLKKYTYVPNHVSLSKTEETHYLSNSKIKTRANFYKLAKENGFIVDAIFYPETFEEVNLKLNGTIEENIGTFSKLQPPIIGIDCDSITLAKGYQKDLAFSAIDYGTAKNPTLDNHDTPHHKEKISEHIKMVENGAKNSNHKYKKILLEVAKFHDLGKYWTKVYDEKVGYYRFPSHENVSACIFLTNALISKKYTTKEISLITKLIQLHMIAKNENFSKKVKNRFQLTEYELKLLSEFTKIDNFSKL